MKTTWVGAAALAALLGGSAGCFQAVDGCGEVEGDALASPLHGHTEWYAADIEQDLVLRRNGESVATLELPYLSVGEHDLQTIPGGGVWGPAFHTGGLSTEELSGVVIVGDNFIRAEFTAYFAGGGSANGCLGTRTRPIP